MKTQKLPFIGLVIALPLLSVWPVQAQTQHGERKYEHQHSRLDLEFPGGSLRDYVDRIRQARPDGAANVVVMPDAETLVVPPVTLVAVTVDAAVQLLEGPYVLPDGRSAHVDVMSYPIGDSPDLVMKVVAHYEHIEVRASVWSVEEALMSGQTAEELLGAIEAVLSLFPEKAKISFHPPTGLLIARGTDEQLDLVREAIQELTEGAERRHGLSRAYNEGIEELEEEAHDLTREIRIAEQEVALARIHFDRRTELRERGGVTRAEVAEAELEVTKAETYLDHHKLQYSRLQKNLESLRNDLKKLTQTRE